MEPAGRGPPPACAQRVGRRGHRGGSRANHPQARRLRLHVARQARGERRRLNVEVWARRRSGRSSDGTSVASRHSLVRRSMTSRSAPHARCELLVPDARSDAVGVGWWEQRQGGPDTPAVGGEQQMVDAGLGDAFRRRRIAPVTDDQTAPVEAADAPRWCATRCGRPPQPRRRPVHSSRCVGTPRLPRRHAAQPTRSTCPSRSRTR
jgi:hypothetical protein